MTLLSAVQEGNILTQKLLRELGIFLDGYAPILMANAPLAFTIIAHSPASRISITGMMPFRLFARGSQSKEAN